MPVLIVLSLSLIVDEKTVFNIGFYLVCGMVICVWPYGRREIEYFLPPPIPVDVLLYMTSVWNSMFIWRSLRVHSPFFLFDLWKCTRNQVETVLLTELWNNVFQTINENTYHTFIGENVPIGLWLVFKNSRYIPWRRNRRVNRETSGTSWFWSAHNSRKMILFTLFNSL